MVPVIAEGKALPIAIDAVKKAIGQSKWLLSVFFQNKTQYLFAAPSTALWQKTTEVVIDEVATLSDQEEMTDEVDQVRLEVHQATIDVAPSDQTVDQTWVVPLFHLEAVQAIATTLNPLLPFPITHLTELLTAPRLPWEVLHTILAAHLTLLFL
jgi:hypothetical protein